MAPSSSDDLRNMQHGSVASKAVSKLSDDTSSNERHEVLNEKPGEAKAYREKQAINDRVPTITEDDPEVYAHLGFCYPTWYKWYILTVIFVIQSSMNFNASIYANGTGGLEEEFGISAQAARTGQLIFLVAYAFGCELWAPWSEEYGRRPILQWSLGLVNLWSIPCAVAPNFGTILVCRFLGGLSSAGGSVTLGMVADMWQPDDQHFAVAYVVFSSVGGSVIGPIVGGFAQTYLSWHWVFWLQLIFGGATQLLHFFTVKETRATVLMNRYAAKLRKDGNANAYTADELEKLRVKESGIWNIDGLPLKEIVTIWIRPFKMFLTEPIVLFLSLLSGFSDALIFTFLESYSPVFKQWGFSTIAIGLAFIPLLVGYFIAWFSFFPWFIKQRKMIKNGTDYPEYRLKWLLFTAPLETIGLFGFAWSSMGPDYNHWIVPLIFSAFVGVANYAIYMATIDYMVAAYGPYAASATGGNGFARDFLAGIAALYATPLYTNIGKAPKSLAYASTILACLAICVTIPIYVFYWKGPAIRARSKFAQEIGADREQHQGKRRASHTPKPEHV
ncbi:putative mfs multidrug transporter protein [Lasiodiplodia theobromae]|uniref:Putative efflux pump kojT n=1 Tax=Lasiodiplodia theobromae TaxID=45133 RepID=A0A5N5DIF1_9PEZI|nr:MFS multidrug transporter [Lasiodiplodia theobromae]KAB2577360.1 putative efflux pump kojT [Lasiodiplodia theobromae]KAF4540399.1 MFS multidrug transporter [Lasiodiplodia theobromae]KAF9640403.1 putative mfs multidrug transporter protein [Lasiodiplodia theobromae]